MILRSSMLLAALLAGTSRAFVVQPKLQSRLVSGAVGFGITENGGLLFMSSSSTDTADSATAFAEDDSDVNNPMKLTPELLKIANAFEAIGDDKLRYKQLLYMANQLAPLDASKQIPENKVPGCLSTVYVDGKVTDDSTVDDVRIEFVGDSDGLLTKGLVALLIRGLSGNSAQAIGAVDPAFIQKAGIAASLTPGRNNGFLNMLAVIKAKAQQLHDDYVAAGGAVNGAAAAVDADDDTSSSGPMYKAMMESLQRLQPTSLTLKDVSYQHAGHAAAGDGDETHFELDIVAPAFDGLNLVKRHQLIYMMLGEIMPQIHALQIVRTKTPEEVGE